jgi:hypothetical protein
MTTPEPTRPDDDTQDHDDETQVPPANPGYSVPPPEGTSSAETD